MGKNLGNPGDFIKVAATSTVTLTDNTTLASPGIDMQDYDAVMFIINATDANADTTIDAKLQVDTVSNFASPTDVSGAAITQDTLANASQAYIIEAKNEDLTQRYVRCLVTMGDGTTGGNCSIIGLGLVANYLPGSDVSTVIEKITK